MRSSFRLLLLTLSLLLCPAPVLADQVTPSDRVETRLRVREGPSTDTPIAGFLEPGETARLTGSVPRWYEIELDDGTLGFVSKSWSVAIPDPTAQTLRVGAWNIKKLGHGSSKDHELVADIIEDNFDVLAVVEVMQKGGGHPGYDSLLTTLGSTWSGLVTSEPRPNTNAGHAEYYAVVWRSALVELCPGITELTYHRDNDGSSTGTGADLFSREPAFTCLRTTNGNFDFSIAAYHARWADGDSEEIADEVDELDDVFTAMSAAFPNEEDLLIIGDFNLVPDDIELALGAESLITGTGSTLNTAGNRTSNLYDHLIVHDTGETSELTGNGVVLDVRGEASSNRVFFQTTSDHLPIQALFRIDGPDDD